MLQYNWAFAENDFTLYDTNAVNPSPA
jgi:hypothetical protein